ncbi:hypothetical protein [Acetobacter okinawensis]|nr:hypothetical protein [Acetobacter okinawensis]
MSEVILISASYSSCTRRAARREDILPHDRGRLSITIQPDLP